MTKEEVLDKYGDLPLKFSGYYKYSFTFTGEKDGVKVSATTGGNAGDIYRMDVSAGSTITLNQTFHIEASVYKDGEELWSEYQ